MQPSLPDLNPPNPDPSGSGSSSQGGSRKLTPARPCLTPRDDDVPHSGGRVARWSADAAMKKNLAGLSLVALALAAGTIPARAEDVKGKFYFGGNLAVLVTTDNIRSNAALIIAPLGNDGAPFTGDRGEEISCGVAGDPNQPANTNVFCDPRPDDLLSRQTQLQQSFKLDGHFGYGLTSNLSIELDTGYYKGDVTNFDVFTRKIIPFNADPMDICLRLGIKNNDPSGPGAPCDLKSTKDRELKQPIKAGTVTEIPVSVNAIVRFRKDSNFNPYIGAGAGYLFTSLNKSPSVDQLNTRLEKLHLISVTDELGPNFGKTLGTSDPDGNAVFRNPASVTIDQGFQWQVIGGGEYFYNDRLSMVFDARYVISSQAVTISLNGQDQIDVTSFTEDIFRQDGSLRVFMNQQTAPNPIIDPNNPGTRYTCDENGDGQFDQPPKDYNHDNKKDACLFNGQGFRLPTQTIVVQGGRIRLSNFSFGFGVRFHF